MALKCLLEIACSSMPDLDNMILLGGLIALFVVERWRAILKASKGRNLIRTGFRSQTLLSRTFRGLSLPIV
jgi:hypothetical protein